MTIFYMYFLKNKTFRDVSMCVNISREEKKQTIICNVPHDEPLHFRHKLDIAYSSLPVLS